MVRLAKVGLAKLGFGQSCAAAHWASWVDSFRMIKQRHPLTARLMVRQLEVHEPVGCFLYFNGRSWQTRPQNVWRNQNRINRKWVGNSELRGSWRTGPFRTQSGSAAVPELPPGRSTALFEASVAPSCGRQHDTPATFAGRGSGEKATLAGARVSTNNPVRDLDLVAHNNLDGRRFEVIVDGLTLWLGAQLAIDTTLVSPLRRDGSARTRAADRDGAVLVEACRRKERTCPELSGEGGWAHRKWVAGGVAKLQSSWPLWQSCPFIVQNRITRKGDPSGEPEDIRETAG